MSISETFQALSDPTRRKILKLLRERSMTAGELGEHFALAKSTLSGHFNVLKHAGLVVIERHATSIVYSLNLSAFEDALSVMLELTSARSLRKARGKSRRIDDSAVIRAVRG
jgi:ArsR family transcriptional regulator, arsenate/arsenite/antimonite-responsive transcriptional repressor